MPSKLIKLTNKIKGHAGFSNYDMYFEQQKNFC